MNDAATVAISTGSHRGPSCYCSTVVLMDSFFSSTMNSTAFLFVAAVSVSSVGQSVGGLIATTYFYVDGWISCTLGHLVRRDNTPDKELFDTSKGCQCISDKFRRLRIGGRGGGG